MARLKRDSYYVDLIEHVLGGVQVMRAPHAGIRLSRLDVTRRRWMRTLTSSEKEVVVAIADRRRDHE